MRWVAVLCVISVGCSSSEDQVVDRAQCLRLRDHLVDLRVRDAASNAEVEAHRDAMKQALGGDFIAKCQEQVSAAELRCALGASELGAATSCSARKAK